MNMACWRRLHEFLRITGLRAANYLAYNALSSGTSLNDGETSNFDALWNARSELQREERARTEHLRVLLRHSIFVFLANLAGSVTLAVGLWTTAQQSLLITWLLVMLAFNVARWFAGRRFPTGFIGEAETRRWEKRFVASVAISGVLWGVAGGLFYVPDQPEYGLFLALLIVGMCAAATASLSYHRIAYPVFLLPAITPIMLHLMSDDKLVANAVGFVIPFYFTLLYLLSRQIYQTAHESILGRINSQYQAMFDHLTGTANRRAFEEAMDREWYRAMRDKHVLSLVIADIDNFKLCNDTNGHAAGDLVLKSVAALLEQHIRRGADLVARIGGEEFAIILPDTNLNGAVALAESIRVSVRKLANSYQREIPEVTMSFGVSSLIPDNSLDAKLLFSRADAAVYKAKRKGKDRVETMNV
jgi:diguanylate cyclase (GGDEF)-like protein